MKTKDINLQSLDAITFEDVNDRNCTIQHERGKNYISIGRDKIRFAHPVYIDDDVDPTYVPYPIPNGVAIDSRICLTRAQLGELLPYLIGYVTNGNLKPQYSLEKYLSKASNSCKDEEQ